MNSWYKERQLTLSLLGIKNKKRFPNKSFYFLATLAPSLDKSGIQNDNSEEPVTNIGLPGAHFMTGGSVSVLIQLATWTR